jgi:hypothetical protein
MNNNLASQTFNVILFTTMLLLSGLLQAQSCAKETIKTAPGSRYVDNGDGTVSDLQVGLVWQKCSIGQSGADCSIGSAQAFKWDQAVLQADLINSSGGFAGHADWRLPKINELRSLVEGACWSPSINITFFPNTPDSDYWSSSTYSGFAKNSWYVSFNNGKSQFNHSNFENHVRLVRHAK